jgi:hypothetical protein
MTNRKPNSILGAISGVTKKIGNSVQRLFDWLVKTPVLKRLGSLAEWIKNFRNVACLVRFSFWISILGSAALFATSQSMDVLRVIVEDPEHRFRRLIVFTISVLVLSMMSWYWARALIYRFEPATLDLPKREARAIAGRWMPRVCGLIPFIGLGYALWHAAHPEGPKTSDEGDRWLMILFWLNLAEGLLVGVGLYFRHTFAKWLQSRLATVSPTLGKAWPENVKSSGTTGLTDLPPLTWIAMLSTTLFALVLLIVFSTSPGQIRFSGYFGPAALVLLSVASWIVLGSFFFIYVGKIVRLPIFTLLLLLAIFFSYFDWNDNHEVRSFDQPVVSAPQDFDAAFAAWWKSRADKESYQGRPYPVFIVTAEGGGITTAYFTATVLTAIQDRSPAFAQHVFAISGVSGGSVGAAVYSGLAKRCVRNLPINELPGQGQPIVRTKSGELQNSADAILTADYLSPVLSAFLYPDLLQRFLPFPVNSLDRARALEARLETSWAEHATCGGNPSSGTNVMSEPFYDLFREFPNLAIPALFFNTTRVETGEQMLVTNLMPSKDRFHRVTSLYSVNSSFNPPLSTAAFLSARFPLVTPAGFISSENGKVRYVDGGYYENSGTATAYNILMSLKVGDAYLYDELRAKQPSEILPVIIRIGVPLPESDKARSDIGHASSQDRTRYRGSGLNEALSPIKTLLNTRGSRGNDAVRQLQSAIQNLPGAPQIQNTCPAGSSGCMFNFDLSEDKVKLPLGWLLSDKSRCEIQKQAGSISSACTGRRMDSAPNVLNQQQLQAIIEMVAPKR